MLPEALRARMPGQHTMLIALCVLLGLGLASTVVSGLSEKENELR